MKLPGGGFLLEVTGIEGRTVYGVSEPDDAAERMRFDMKKPAWKRLVANATVVRRAEDPAPVPAIQPKRKRKGT